MKIDYKEIINTVKNKNIVSRTLLMLIGVIILAMNYNIFFLENNLVVGGTSGLAIVLNKLFNIPPAEFIFIIGIILLVLSYFLLGKEQTSRTVIGAILYPVFIIITAPLCTLIIPHVQFSSLFLTSLIAGMLFGLANGIIYKTGFTTGGSDILIQIINKFVKIPIGKSVFITNILIICSGGFVFGISDMLYSIIVLILSSNIIDRILIGISSSKMFFVYTKKITEVEDFIINQLNTGVTIFNAEGGYSNTKKKMIMCVVPNKDYFIFKESILSIDANAFFVINDCYEVSGGVKRSNLPFI